MFDTSVRTPEHLGLLTSIAVEILWLVVPKVFSRLGNPPKSLLGSFINRFSHLWFRTFDIHDSTPLKQGRVVGNGCSFGVITLK